MSIRRVVPDIKSKNLAESRAFYVDFLGMNLAMDMGFRHDLRIAEQPDSRDQRRPFDDGSTLPPHVSVEVADVDQMHKRAIERGLKIVYPLTDEPWGVRRFFVVDPTKVNYPDVLSHLLAGFEMKTR